MPTPLDAVYLVDIPTYRPAIVEVHLSLGKFPYKFLRPRKSSLLSLGAINIAMNCCQYHQQIKLF